METIVAIDLGKRKSVVCSMDRGSLKTQYKTVRTQPDIFHDLFAELDANKTIVLFEVGNQAGWVADMLRSMGLGFKVANTNDPAWKWANNPVKSDKKDALRLAMMYHQGFFPEVHVPIKEVRQKRMLITYRQSLVSRTTQIKNSVRAILCTMGMDWPAGKSGWGKKSLKQLAEYARSPETVEDDNDLWRVQLYAELQLYMALQKQLENVTAKLDALNKPKSTVALLQTVPGVGPRTAEALVAVIDDPHRFKNCRQVCSYVGFAPRRYQSGEMDRTGRISKRGNPLLRMLLVQAGWASLQYAWAKEIYNRVSGGSAKRRKTAIVAVARHILMRCWAMLRDNQPWRCGAERVAAWE